MREQGGHLVARRRLIAELTIRDVENAGAVLESKLGLIRVSTSEIGSSGSRIAQSVKLVSGRFAVMQRGKEFALIPWQQAMRMRKREGPGIEALKGVSR